MAVRKRHRNGPEGRISTEQSFLLQPSSFQNSTQTPPKCAQSAVFVVVIAHAQLIETVLDLGLLDLVPLKHHSMAVTPEQLTTIGDQFLASYYQTFDTNRAALSSLYVSLEGFVSSLL